VSVDNKGNEITKVYDKAGRLKYVVDDELVSGSSISSADSTKLTEYNYYDNGARESIRHPQFTEGSNTYRYRQTYNYRNDGLLNILITHKMEITANGENVNSQLERFQYYYDNAGNQTSKFEIVDGVVKGTTDFEYDDLNRLEKVTEPEGRETVYTFDAAGNRKTEAITESGATINKIYHYNDKNWLEEVEVLGAETIEYDYDEDGNQTEVRKIENGVTEVIAEYKYDPLNRLVEAVTDTGAVTYAYNGEGRRVEKSTGQGTIYYLYEYDKVVLEVDGTGDQVARNLYGINLLMRDVDEDSYYYVYNGHADVTALINANTGSVDATYYYDPFGNILESTGNVNNNITYAGYQYDEETGLYYLNARMYDPKIARFLQEDTYRGDPNDPLSLNLYAYCANEPIMYFDPTGHRRQGDIFSYNANTYNLDVAILQKRLRELGYYGRDNKGLSIDGLFGDNTLHAVLMYQSDMKNKQDDFLVDGLVGDQTWYALGLGDIDWNNDGWDQAAVMGIVKTTYSVMREFGNVHSEVQQLASKKYGLVVEYTIKGGGLKPGKTDGFADLVDLKTCEVWEVKNDTIRWNEVGGEGRDQLQRYITASHNYNGNIKLKSGAPRLYIEPFKTTVFGREATVTVRSGNANINLLENGMLYYKVKYDDKKNSKKNPVAFERSSKNNNKDASNQNKKSTVLQFPTNPNTVPEKPAAIQPMPTPNPYAGPPEPMPSYGDLANPTLDPNRGLSPFDKILLTAAGGVVIIGSTGLVVYAVGNNVTGIGVADDLILLPAASGGFKLGTELILLR
jgi:RHS repeat-associated protein